MKLARNTLITLAVLIFIGSFLFSYYTSYKILKQFHTMEVSFNKANKNVKSKNDKLLEALEEQAGNRGAEVKPYYNRALEVKKISDDFVKYIENIKDTLINRTGTYEADNLEEHANYFFKNPDDRKARELTKMINTTRIKLLNRLSNGNGVEIDSFEKIKVINSTNLKTDYDKATYPSWASMYFEHSPLAGVITMLTKIQSDCRNTEADIIELLAKSIDRDKAVFDRLEAIIISNSLMVKVGTEYKSEILLVASNSKSDNPVIVNGHTLPIKNGKGIYTKTPSAPGVYYLEGAIRVKTPTGVKEYPFKEKYVAY